MRRLLYISLCPVLLSTSALAAEDTPASMSASELANRLRRDDTTYVRARLSGGSGTPLQLQIKERHTKSSVDLVYQVLFPKERKGEAVLLRRSGSRTTGSIFTPPDKLRSIDNMKDGLFDSALTYEDLVDDFFTWSNQAIVGTEVVDRVNCQILESKPGKGERSSYGSVKSWIDMKRIVPLRVEKYSSSGALVKRIDTARVHEDDQGQPIPATLTVRGSGGSAELAGSKIRHDIAFTDRDFSPEGLKELNAPKGSE